MRARIGLLSIVLLICATFPGCRQGVPLETQSHETQSHETFWDNGNLRLRSFYYLDHTGQKVLHGEQLECFESGQPRLRLYYVSGKREGTLTEWGPNGKKAREGDWKNNQESGRWTAWQPTGDKYWEATYSEGRIVGKRVAWMSGRVVLEETYDGQGELAEMVQYHDDGTLTVRGRFLHGKRHGTWTHWDEAGAVVAVGEWRDGKPWSGMVATPVAGDAGYIGGLTEFKKYQAGRVVE